MLWYPSETLLHFLKTKINPEAALRTLPIFGSITPETRNNHILRGYHPTSYYNRHILSNPHGADNLDVIGVAITFHDMLGHGVMGTLLTREARRFCIEILPLEGRDEQERKELAEEGGDFLIRPLNNFEDRKKCQIEKTKKICAQGFNLRQPEIKKLSYECVENKITITNKEKIQFSDFKNTNFNTNFDTDFYDGAFKPGINRF